MARRPVVLGWPISLALRGLQGLSTLSPAVAVGLGAGAAASVGLVATQSPWIRSRTDSDSSSLIPESYRSLVGGDLSVVTDFMGGILTFMDMNANVMELSEQRRIAVVSVPGRGSDYLQDLGQHTARYSIRGKFFDTDPQYLTQRGVMQTILKTVIGSSAVGSTQILRLIMNTGSPVPFVSEHEISFAVISKFSFSQQGGEPGWVDYNMNLLEYSRIPYVAKMAMLGASNLVSRGVQG